MRLCVRIKSHAFACVRIRSHKIACDGIQTEFSYYVKMDVKHIIIRKRLVLFDFYFSMAYRIDSNPTQKCIIIRKRFVLFKTVVFKNLWFCTAYYVYMCVWRCTMQWFFLKMFKSCLISLSTFLWVIVTSDFMRFKVHCR